MSTLPTASVADGTSPLLFMAPEFWGDAVAEPATSSWASLNLESIDEAADRWLGHDDLLFDDEERLVGFTVGRGPGPGSPRTLHRRSRLAAIAGAVAVVAAFATAFACAGVLFVRSVQDGTPTNSALAELSTALLLTPAVPEPLVGTAVAGPIVIAPITIPVASAKPRALRELAQAARHRLAAAAEVPEVPLRPRTAPSVAPARERAEPAITPTPRPRRRSPLRHRPRREPTAETTALGSGSMSFDRDELLLPETLSSVQLRVALRQVMPLATNCVSDGGPRRATVALVIHGSNGRVTRARVSGPLATTTEGACVERALRRARFPRFTNSSLEVSSFPLVLR